jgi:hypothetical protein
VVADVAADLAAEDPIGPGRVHQDYRQQDQVPSSWNAWVAPRMLPARTCSDKGRPSARGRSRCRYRTSGTSPCRRARRSASACHDPRGTPACAPEMSRKVVAVPGALLLLGRDAHGAQRPDRGLLEQILGDPGGQAIEAKPAVQAEIDTCLFAWMHDACSRRQGRAWPSRSGPRSRSPVRCSARPGISGPRW